VPGEAFLVLGAERGLVEEALKRGGPDADVIVIDPSVSGLQAREQALADPRVWFLIGDAEVLPLPDASVDAVLGRGETAELERVCR
jgi:ubiquinone/menaquinone biosynthesis C-methylase UbiE